MSNTETITLETPIKRGENAIEKLDLRKPNSGELRGLSMTDLLKMEVTAVQTIIPRISDPVLTIQEVAELDMVDLLEIGKVVVGFFMSKDMKV